MGLPAFSQYQDAESRFTSERPLRFRLQREVRHKADEGEENPDAKHIGSMTGTICQHNRLIAEFWMAKRVLIGQSRCRSFTTNFVNLAGECIGECRVDNW